MVAFDSLRTDFSFGRLGRFTKALQHFFNERLTQSSDVGFGARRGCGKKIGPC